MQIMFYFALFKCLFQLLFAFKYSKSMEVSFCDGHKFVKYENQICTGGINFGDRKPDCVCISGIYRLWMDDCVVYDGFMEGGCIALKQDGHYVVGIRFTGDVGNFSRSTLAVFAKHDLDYNSWSAYQLGEYEYSSSNNFYTIHGDAYALIPGSKIDSRRPFVCVESKHKSSDAICRYHKEDDRVWSKLNGSVEITVKKDCTARSGWTKHAMKPRSCYEVMGASDSECSLPCKGSHMDDHISTKSNTVPIPAMHLAALLFHKPPFVPEIPSVELDEFGNINETNTSSITFLEELEEDNFFLNRRLNHYSKLRQVGYIKPNDLAQIPPSRTFELLDIVKKIAKKACSSQYVSSLFIDHAVDLFVILHKGRNYRYSQDLTKGDYEWIKTILAGCHVDINDFKLVLEENEFSDRCKDFQKVRGVCPETWNNCTLLKVPESHSELGKYHFVVEATWDLVDLAHSLCFPSFAQSYRMFHRWEQATEKLFTREIRKLWYNPNLSLKVYQSLLTPSALVDMYNLEMCVEAAYTLNPALTRLRRPMEPLRSFRRKKREVKVHPQLPPSSPHFSNLDIHCHKRESQFHYPYNCA